MVWLLSLSKVHGKKVGSNLIHEPKAEENLIGKKWKWSRSVMSDSVTKWTVAHQAPLPMGFSRQEYCVGCHSLLQGIFPPRDGTWVSRIAGKCFTLWATMEAPTGKNWELIGQRSPADYNHGVAKESDMTWWLKNNKNWKYYLWKTGPHPCRQPHKQLEVHLGDVARKQKWNWAPLLGTRDLCACRT